MKCLMALCVAAALLVSCSVGGVYQTDGDVRTYGEGRLVQREGHRVLHLAGSYYEMGYQYGVLLRDELIELAELYYSYIGEYMAELPWYKQAFSDVYLTWKLDEYKKGIPAKYLDEIRGISDGAGVSLDACMLAASRMDAFCTAIAARTTDGLVVGKNVDWGPDFLGDYMLVTVYRPDGEPSYTTHGFMGFTGMLVGWNENGIYLTQNATSTASDPLPTRDPHLDFKLRDILCTARTLADVEVSLAGYVTDVPALVLASSLSESTACEIDLDYVATARTDMDGTGILWVLNNYVSAEVRRTCSMYSMAEGAYDLERSAYVRSFLATNGVTSQADVLELLSGSTFQGVDVWESGLCLPNNDITLATVVVNQSTGEVLLSAGTSYAACRGYVQYDPGTEELESYRTADAGKAELVDWLDGYYACPWDQKAAWVLANTDPSQDLSARQLSVVVYYYKDLGGQKPDAQWLLDNCTSLIARFPFAPSAYVARYRLLESLDRRAEGIPDLRRLVDDPTIICGSDKTYYLYLLMEYYAGVRDRAGFDACYAAFEVLRAYVQGSYAPYSMHTFDWYEEEIGKLGF